MRRLSKRRKAAKPSKGSKALSGKAAKSSKGSKPLIATVKGDNLIGTTTLRFNADGSFLVSMDLNGLPPAGNSQAVITMGTSCDVQNLTHFTKTSGDEFDGSQNMISSLAEGISKSAFRFNNGYKQAEIMGKTVIIYHETEVIGCGVIGKAMENEKLVAEIGSYPGYTGDLKAGGHVTVTFNDDDTFKFQYDVSGLEANCNGCGIHIHAGVSCATHAEVLGHYWNSVVVQDLWTAAGGAVYNTDSSGSGDGYFEITNGFGYEENKDHAVVMHQQDGTRIGCGVLM